MFHISLLSALAEVCLISSSFQRTKSWFYLKFHWFSIFKLVKSFILIKNFMLIIKENFHLFFSSDFISILSFFFFSALPHSLQDPSSITRGWTYAHCSRNVESKPQTTREVLMLLFLKSHVLHFSSFAFSFWFSEYIAQFIYFHYFLLMGTFKIMNLSLMSTMLLISLFLCVILSLQLISKYF